MGGFTFADVNECSVVKRGHQETVKSSEPEDYYYYY